MAVPLLDVRHLTKRFGGLTAVDDVDLQVFPGEVVALLGDNGAGKSTLIKMVSGVYQPDEGQIFFQVLIVQKGSNSPGKSFFCAKIPCQFRYCCFMHAVFCIPETPGG